MTNPWHARDPLSIFLVAGLTVAHLTASGQSSARLSSAEATNPALSMPSPGSAEVKAEKADVEERDYTSAESRLLEEIRQHPDSPELLDLLGGIFFLHGKYFNSAIAYNKEEVLKRLSTQSRFKLAMAYILIGHRDWARPEVERLARESPNEALYPYWLSRLDYDAQLFERAIAEAEASIERDPRMARAHDNLGLCYEAIGRFDEAIREYQEAANLERREQQPSPWPDVNMATLLVKLGRLDGVENTLREALQFDPRFPSAHYQLGLLFEKQGNNREAIKELQQAVHFDPSFDQPFYALGRIYQRAGERQKAESAYEEFRRLKEAKAERKEAIR
jgi:tetratricopeptide (TPR) repeat protein